jgi:hypothetical protein
MSTEHKLKIIRSPEWREKQRKAQLGKKSPNLGKHLSLEWKEKLRQSQLKSYQNGRTPPNKGKHLSEETKQKLREHMIGNKFWLGKHHTEETKKKIGLCSKGRHHKSSLLGRHLSEEHKQRIRLGCKGINTGKRSPFSEEWRRKLGLASKGKKRTFTPEWKKHLCIAQKEMSARIRISKPQKELFEFLKQIFPDATLEYPIQTKETFRFADIGIPSLQIDFEYDEKYWHEKRKDKDQKRDEELAKIGWITFRVTEESLKRIITQKTVVDMVNYVK